MKTDQILLLYDLDYVQANTVTEHINSFSDHSSFCITAVNVHAAWKYSTQQHSPSRQDSEEVLKLITGYDYACVILHYSLFGMDIYYFGDPILAWLQNFNGLKIAFFQDEYYRCPKRFQFINDFNIDVVYTLLEPRYFQETYLAKTCARSIHYTIPGFVSDQLIETSKTLSKEIEKKDIDVGYRGRQIDFTFGQAGQEKHLIGKIFIGYLKKTDLIFDIETKEEKRIYGPEWPRFLYRCRTLLGVEAGVSIFDLEDEVRLGAVAMRAENPAAGNTKAFEEVMKSWEDKITYRTISPRHFEAAALNCCQVLFEGRYSGIMEAGLHYIELKKDFSNIEEVIETIQDHDHCRTIADKARKDLIESGRWSYDAFFKEFDTELRRQGLRSAK